jgi:hypothetical protein
VSPYTGKAKQVVDYQHKQKNLKLTMNIPKNHQSDGFNATLVEDEDKQGWL